jgi:hypothetical protein
MSGTTKFFLGSLVFFIGAVGVSAALFYGGVNTTSPGNIDIQVITPSLIDGGKAAQLEVIITNRNTTALELADLVIDYPDGARDPADPTKTLTHQRISIGTIKSGEQLKRTASALLYGSEGTQEKVVARLEYSLVGSNGVFEKSGEASFTIGSAPVSLVVSAPSAATAGDQFGIDVTVRSNAAGAVENVAVEAQYPFGFSVSGSQPQGGAGNTIWRLGTLAPGASKVIHITGSIDAADGDERVFRFLVGSNSDQTDPHVRVPYLTVPQTLTVERPFITGSIALEGKSGTSISIPAGKTLQGSVTWENNLSDSVSDLELTLGLDGPAVDRSSINSSNGFYQSNTNQIVWTSAGEPSLASVPPGAQGTFQFSFKTLGPGEGGTLITNPTVTLNLTVKATRQGGGSSSNVTSAATMKATLASQLEITAQSLRNSVFPNTGPIPPRAEANTTYTVTLSVKNSANTIANAVAQTVLPPYVTYNSSGGNSEISYDAGSRTVKWTLGDVKPGVGYTAAARQASFQVILTPSTSQVGQAPQLTGPITISGTDRFAQVQVDANAEGPTSATSDGSNGTVAPK